MTERTTAAGRALLAMLTANDGYAPFTEDILAIEAEARATALGEARTAVEALIIATPSADGLTWNLAIRAAIDALRDAG